MWTFKKDIFKTDDSPPFITCGGSINAAGNEGIYEIILQAGNTTGLTGVKINAASVPDRFQLYYNDELVADSKYIGNGYLPGPPVTPFVAVIGEYDLEVFNYNGSTFDPTGEIRNVVNTQSDIPDNITEPTSGMAYLYFNKETTSPSEIKLVVTGVSSSTAWQVFLFQCPINVNLLPEGEEKFIYGFLPESLKESDINNLEQCTSKKIFLGSSPIKFYSDPTGLNPLSDLGWTSTNKYINDGITWWELNSSGDIISTGTI